MAEPQPPHEERTRRTPETLTRQWARIRQPLRGSWDHLPEHDLDHLAGQHDRLVQVIQERYRSLGEHAQAEVDRRLQASQPAGGQMAEALIAAAGASPLELDAPRSAG